jgi:hypothetical protein
MADPITPTERNLSGIIYFPAGTVPSQEADIVIKAVAAPDSDLKIYVNDELVYGE